VNAMVGLTRVIPGIDLVQEKVLINGNLSMHYHLSEDALMI
jgi:hypothetical protein